MQDIVSPLQSISYTKKDFQTIYPELLDLVKELTNKWDPSISNESDPGVILIKLNALIADKCNYNIDKNVLECFPLSVTQTHNARQLFEQLGYYMKWYRSATALVSLKWIGEQSDFISYPIPPFTMITDQDKTVVYTITGYIPSVAGTEFSVGKVDLPQCGATINVKCIQGIAVKYDINGDTVITPQHLDSDNRIYFNSSNIAENGIFITNVGTSTNYGEWERKDNLLIEEFGNYYYKFGITEDGTSCYIEFPDDYETIMKDGVEITYIRTDGQYGNITSNQLSNFYADVSVINSIGDQVVLNSQNVKIRNYFASTNGADYETIDDAYKNYKKVVGTFETLVTLRDYFNYIVSHNLVSNGFVCDRSNDLQNVYNVMSYSNGVNQINSIVEKVDQDPTLTAFSIKLYLTKYYQDVSTINSFNGTFQPVGETESSNIQQYVEDLKSLQHDFVPLDSPDDVFSHFCMFKNKYPVICNIIPQYAVSSAQKVEIINNVRIALYQYLNAKELNFGDKIDPDYLYKVILESDNRIKNVILDNINYTTYAVYYDKNTKLFYEVKISGEIPDSCVVDSLSSELRESVSVDATTFINKLVSTNTFTSYAPLQFTRDNGQWELDGSAVTLSQYGITIDGSYTQQDLDSFTVQISKQTQFRNEVLAKSMLAGITPLLLHAEQFDFQMNQSKTGVLPQEVSLENSVDPIITDIVSVYPKTTIQIASTNADKINGSYSLKENETIQLFAPNLLAQKTYNNYVKFECKLNSIIDPGTQEETDKIISPNTVYQLQENEYIVFYWKASSSDSIYSYVMYGDGSIIKSSFALRTNNSTSVASSLATKLANITSIPKILDSDSYVLNFEESQEIQEIRNTDNILSDNKKIEYFITNTITINDNMYCYWSLKETQFSEEAQTYTLFKDGETQRLLESGEYFFYTDSQMVNLITLGEGTLIVNGNPSSTDSWTVQAISLTDITLMGIDAITGYWYKPAGFLTITEEQFININPGYRVRLQLKDRSNPILWTATITNDGTVFSPDTLSYQDFNIQYQIQNAEWVSVPDLNLGQDFGWQGKSLLSLNISKNMSEVLYSNQSVLVTTADETEILIQGANKVTNSTHTYQPVVLLSDHDIYCTGQSEISTIYYTNYYEWSYLSLYVFAQEESRSGKVVYGNSNCIVPVKSGASVSENSKPMVFLLPAGYYILPVFLPYQEDTYFKVGVKKGSTTTYLRPIYDSSMVQLSGGRLYPLVYQSTTNYLTDSNSQLRIYLVNQGGSSVTALDDMNIQISNPLHYIPTDELARNVALVRMFDVDNIFDYTYEVSQDKLIENPLEAKQFLNTNHIYKKYTICQFDTSSNTKIQVN